MKTFFKILEYCYLVESIKIENVTFQFKTALSEVTVKTNINRSTKWIYYKEQNFASNYFFFFDNFVSV